MVTVSQTRSARLSFPSLVEAEEGERSEEGMRRGLDLDSRQNGTPTPRQEGTPEGEEENKSHRRVPARTVQR